MNRKIKSLFVAAGLFAFCGSAFAGEIIENADFETGDLSGWSSPQQSGGSIKLYTVQAEEVHDGKYSLVLNGDSDNRYNSFITLVQPLKIKPNLKTQYRISGYARCRVKNPDKVNISIAVRETDSNNQSIIYRTAKVYAENDKWVRYSLKFTADNRCAAFQIYLIAKDLETGDVVYFDNIEFSKIDMSQRKFNPDSSLSAPPKTIEMKTENFRAEIDASTGMICRTFCGSDILQPYSKNAALVYMEHNDKEQFFFKDTCSSGSEKDGTANYSLKTTDASEIVDAEISYSTENGCIKEKVVFRALADMNENVKLGLRHGFLSEKWDKIICATRPLKIVKSSDQAFFSYKNSENDLSINRLDMYQGVVYPMTILENKDYFLITASMNMDKNISFSPNYPEGYFPSLQLNPRKMKKGDLFEISLLYKAFPKKKFMLRDVWRWYSMNIHSDNEAIRNVIRYVPHTFRHLEKGLFQATTYFKEERENRLFLPGNIWWYGWHDWIGEKYPIEGEWFTQVYQWGKMSAEKMKSEITRLQAKGLSLFMYFRQIANLKLRENGTLPSDWFVNREGGSMELYEGAFSIPIPENVSKSIGYNRIPWGTYNFDNSDFRRYYFEQVRKCMDFYNPAGIAWDMGWDPEIPGILRTQADIYKWLKENHPSKKVISNESMNPTQFYSDAVMLENGFSCGKTNYDFEVCKAFNTAIICAERFNIFDLAFDASCLNKKNWLSAQFPAGIAENDRFLNFLLSIKPELRKDAENATRLCQIRASLRDLGLGASPGYLEEAKPVADEIVRFASDVLGLPMITESFAVCLPSGIDQDKNTFASVWASEEKIRIVVYNDNPEKIETELFIKKESLENLGFNPVGISEGKSFFLSPLGASEQSSYSLKINEKGIKISLSIEPFTSFLYFKDDIKSIMINGKD
ncbi:MAG: hypothetical protein A2020_15285 [Lentisphaerae bacterium GWF2_45_14]|nr:MAG: hypothetical protein A2020_15285 [Lentisphaerae bacterium GWF2_45_14]